MAAGSIQPGRVMHIGKVFLQLYHLPGKEKLTELRQFSGKFFSVIDLKVKLMEQDHDLLCQSALVPSLQPASVLRLALWLQLIVQVLNRYPQSYSQYRADVGPADN